jgi:hypothetical protein
MHVTRAADEDAPTTELLTGAVGDRCPNCHSPMASDQRYCVNCGARRGKPRFTPEAVAAQTSPAPLAVSERPPPPHSRFSAATTLVAGVATLLLAMGVGVLIGHNTSTPTRAAAPQIITVAGGAANGNAASAGTPSTAARKRGAKLKVKTTVVHVSAKTAKAAAAAAAKVLGGSAPKNPTIQPGQSCTAGTAGCQNGTFTGNFFGGQ